MPNIRVDSIGDLTISCLDKDEYECFYLCSSSDYREFAIYFDAIRMQLTIREDQFFIKVGSQFVINYISNSLFELKFFNFYLERIFGGR